MQELFIKICGITNLDDARLASELGANAVGFIFHKGSERYISPEHAVEIARQLPEHLSKIGVFVHADSREIVDTARLVSLSAVQLTGDEGPDDLVDYEFNIIKVFRVRPGFDVETMQNYLVDAFLLDTYKEGAYGGTGKTFDWNVAVQAKRYGRIILSGGLDPDNIEPAVKFVRPYGVDVSSGVEMHPGKKHPAKLRDFISRARNAYLSVEPQ
ncbi:MAG: hypothetical protein A2X67_01365 [Ignavibacteria bacterium GWA2_55_11]|nr:MAG: hypothetical protein A2X67_01365 [Ignavibacteria bacterium GWA2_55_11]OGU44660.1 MAG: hypothetical protein A2X68_08375 [Ignavibacteria bacterium GWC2_56_12]OGU72197.1 MAG: hypothetical protein A3H45_04925 [Ignavibacteria bacterium RIFCSPLOWO2_02_FULL_55_14]OGU76707.1 MAG: hypothetical protein A3G43_03820 [Ignavibacteria bacterium RIFCSPLOWO2_12_FULL_56_21]HAV22139.1 phosphoribosylanthranilate isomerase [Bacteroidota bacterium]